MPKINLNFKGKNYSIDKSLLAGAISDLETHFGNLGSSIPSPAGKLEGDGGEYYTLAPTALTFRSTEPLADFQEVKVNGQVVDPSNYTLEEGSTIVTLSIDYLKTLPVGDYNIDVASANNTQSGGFTVKSPELNEHGFYYNQPYTAFVDYFGAKAAFFIRDNGTFDAIVLYYPTAVTETSTYTVSGNSMTVASASMGELHLTFSEDGTEVYNTELGANFVLGNESMTADEDYIYIYDSSSDAYEVAVIDKSKTSYGAIRTGVNGKPTVKLQNFMFVDVSDAEKYCPITSVIIPDSVITIGDNAFEGCTLLENVIFGENSNLERIEDYAFYDCESLTSITLPNSVYYLGDGVFTGCKGIINLVLPNKLLSLGSNMCLSCVNLSSVTIPSGIRTIYDSAFGDCINLTSIEFKGTVAQWNAITKESGWNLNVPATYVQCSDGQVAL